MFEEFEEFEMFEEFESCYYEESPCPALLYSFLNSHSSFLREHSHHPFQRGYKHVYFFGGIVECKRRPDRSGYAE